MTQKAPPFWYGDQQPTALTRGLLFLCSRAYGFGHRLHQHFGKARKMDIPVLCIGNLVAGGGGKTPTALAVMDLIRAKNIAHNPCFLSRGYGGTLSGPLRVDPALHTAAAVGDEPLLLAQKAPTFIAANRADGAQLAQDQGHDFIIMDDGLQNPSLHKDIALLVIDGATGFGNEKLLPAGPLRSPVESGMRRVDAVLLIGEDRHHIKRHIPADLPILRAGITPLPPPAATTPYIGFCGIAHPGKFQNSLTEAGLDIVGFHDFPDHHPYRENELEALKTEAQAKQARLITTAKDAVRLPPGFAAGQGFDILSIALSWTDNAKDTLCKIITAKTAR